MEKLLETWRINQRMNESLIVSIDEKYYGDVLNGKGRKAGDQLAHIHNVRLMWLKVAAPELLEKQTKIEKETALTRKIIFNQLESSAVAIEELLKRGFETGRIKGFKPHPEAFLGYMIAHEAHHRGQVILTLKSNGHIPDQKTLYGLWEWGTK